MIDIIVLVVLGGSIVAPLMYVYLRHRGEEQRINEEAHQRRLADIVKIIKGEKKD